MTPAQCRAARALVGMSQDRLAEASGVAKRTIASFEKEDRQPYERTISALRAALETAGVIFTDNGVGLGGGEKLSTASVEQALAVAHEINAEAAKGSGKIDDTDARIQRENLKLFLWKMKLEIVPDEDGRERLVLAPLS